MPEICLETPLIDYGRCFIRYPYEKIVVLKNETDLPAKYELLPQVCRYFFLNILFNCFNSSFVSFGNLISSNFGRIFLWILVGYSFEVRNASFDLLDY